MTTPDYDISHAFCVLRLSHVEFPHDKDEKNIPFSPYASATRRLYIGGIQVLDTVYNLLNFVFGKQIYRLQFQLLSQSAYIRGFIVRKLVLYCLTSSVMAYMSSNMHIQDKMRFAGFSNWTAFKVEKKYAEQWAYFSSQSGCSSVLISTVVTRVDDRDYTKTFSSENQFTVERHQQSLFYELIERDGFERVNSDTSFNTHRFNADDSGGYQRDEYRVPKCETSFFKKQRK
jgi:hypothetical protein